MQDVPVDTEAWRLIYDLGCQPDRKGIVLPLSDLVISVCSQRVDATVISNDPHFSKIPGPKVRTGIKPFELHLG